MFSKEDPDMARPEMRPNTHGKMSFSPRESGGFEASWYYRDAHGNRKRMKASGRTKSRAREELEFKWETRDLSDADSEVTGSTTIEELGQLWLKSLRGRAPGTMAAYRNRIRISISPFIGDKKIRDVTPGYIEAHLRRIADGNDTRTITYKKSAARTIPTGGLSAERTARIVLHGMFDHAVSFNALPSGINPVGKDKRQAERKAKRSKVRAMTRAEYFELVRRIEAWQAAQPSGPPRGVHLRPAIDVMLGTGVRSGELLAIRWEDVRLEEDIPFILVSGTIAQNEEGKWHRQDWTKGDRFQVAKIQPIALPPHVVDLLEKRRANLDGHAEGLIFKSQVGGLVLTSNFRRSWRQARQYDNRTGDDFAWVKPKSLRKSTATMIKRSSGLEAAAEQLRHSSSAVTREYYVEEELVMVDNRAVFDDIFAQGGK
ncbi:tyrosine-type recombinase/integrase [Arthrobacter sp. VKM Ac-2550]|uniref:tyrosine-type recombinase/integrase n=1 Tax=Crystallibacter permensis TaxID=1938888 RepID=UPI00222790EC|nr:site-specific integrase [Arthrobacter sp. VKM Ac-2550]